MLTIAKKDKRKYLQERRNDIKILKINYKMNNTITKIKTNHIWTYMYKTESVN